MMPSTMKTFRLIALLEGISFLVLLLIAMPLKYMMDMPLPVKITGMAHGLLFTAFVILLGMVHFQRKWPLKRTFLAFLSSFLPFGTFVLDAKVLKHETE
jgi:integral membrane protein